MSNIRAGVDQEGLGLIVADVDDEPGLGSAVSWAAIFAGASGAAALSLILLILGTGLGFSATSPWTMEGISATTFGFAAILWVSFTQVAASGMGGYLAGRLRNRWQATQPDEVYFRDTAHGFLTWAVATLLTVVVLTSMAGSIVSSGVSAGAAVANGAASTIGEVAGSAGNVAATVAADEAGTDEVSSTIDYFVDSLFRDDSANSTTGPAQQINNVSATPVGEVTRIFARAMRTGTLPQDDARYIGRLIAQRTNLSQQDAELRVADAFNDAQTALDEAKTTALAALEAAREASAAAALWMFVALLIGAFTASVMAIVGGRQRDA